MSIVFLVHPGTWEWSLPSGGLLEIRSGGVRGADMVSIGGQLADVYRHGEKVHDVRVGTAMVDFPLPGGPPPAPVSTARLSEMVAALAGLSSKALTIVVGPAKP
jgi:hypothetical protein